MAFVQKWDSVEQGWPDSGITTASIVPTGQAAGSLLVFVVDQRASSTITETSGNGWIDSGLTGHSTLLTSKIFYKLATGDSGTDTATFSSDISQRSYGSLSEFSEIKSPLNLEDAVVGVIAAGDVGVDYPNATATTSSGTAVVTANANIWNTALPYTFQNAIAHFSRNAGSTTRPGHTLGSFDYASSGAVTDTATSAATATGQAGFILLFEKSGGATPVTVDPDSVTTIGQIGNVTIFGGGADLITPDTITTQGTIDNVTLAGGTFASITPNTITTQGQVGFVALSGGQPYTIDPDSVTTQGIVDSVTISQQGELAVLDAVTQGAIDNVVVTVSYTVTPDDLTTQGVTWNVVVSQDGEIVPATLGTLGTIDNVILTQRSTIAPDTVTTQGQIGLVRFSGLAEGTLEGEIMIYPSLTGNPIIY